MGKKSEYEKFKNFVDNLVRVPHSEIKTKLEEERKAKTKRKLNKKK